MSYSITIAGVDRTNCIKHKTVHISDEAKDKPSTMRFIFEDQDGNGAPNMGDEIIVVKDSERLFAGVILTMSYNRIGTDQVVYTIACIDWTRELDRRVVVESYEEVTDKYIFQDVVARYTAGSGITTVNVEEGVTIKRLPLNYTQPSQVFRKVADLTGRSWYLDYYKDVHYFSKDTSPAPFNIDENSTDYWGLSITKDITDIRNRVYVKGGKYLSDFTTISQKADGEQTVFLLPSRPSSFSITEGGVSKTVGIKNIDDAADYDYLLNYQEKYVEKANGVPPAADTTMAFTFKYEIPVLVAVEDRESIEDIGVYEYPIFDPSIVSQEVARNRAQAELADYANTIVDGSFKTNVDGFRAGQYININHSDFDVNEDYLVQKVTAQSLGAGLFEYTVSVANTKKLGIINFLIRLLENDKNHLDLDPDEVVDELFTPDSQGIYVSDSIVQDSLITPPFKWGQCKWGLAEWS